MKKSKKREKRADINLLVGLQDLRKKPDG